MQRKKLLLLACSFTSDIPNFVWLCMARREDWGVILFSSCFLLVFLLHDTTRVLIWFCRRVNFSKDVFLLYGLGLDRHYFP